MCVPLLGPIFISAVRGGFAVIVALVACAGGAGIGGALTWCTCNLIEGWRGTVPRSVSGVLAILMREALRAVAGRGRWALLLPEAGMSEMCPSAPLQAFGRLARFGGRQHFHAVAQPIDSMELVNLSFAMKLAQLQFGAQPRGMGI